MAKSAAKRESTVPAQTVSTLVRSSIWLLALIQIVCPLLLFTNLTRNPYYTQIALLNIGIAVVAALWAVDGWFKGEWRVPRFPFEWPLLFFLLAALASTLVSWTAHATIRPGIAYEGTRVWVFTLVNCVMALCLPVLFLKPRDPARPLPSINTDIFFGLLWCGLWFGFQSMKDTDSSSLIWDTYGGFLWALACLYAVLRVREADTVVFLHLILNASMVAALYALMQYMGRELIWTSVLQPYGGRPVSTFGNPNFLSSHLMLSAPLAVALSLRAEKKEKWGYLFIGLVCSLGVLCTLTRSSYLGLIAAFLVMGILLKAQNNVNAKWIGLALAIVVGLIIIFPHSP